MKTDVYTKAMLTVIAGCLTIMVIKNVELVPTATAASGLKQLSGYGLVPLNADGSINVKLKAGDSPMQVELVRINTWDELNVKMKSGDPVKVDLVDIHTYNKLGVVIKDVDSYAFSNCTVPVKNK